MKALFAFFGTGECDPHKDLKQFVAYAGIVAGWVVIILIIRKLRRSDKPSFMKAATTAALSLAGMFGTLLAAFAVYIGLACSG